MDKTVTDGMKKLQSTTQVQAGRLQSGVTEKSELPSKLKISELISNGSELHSCGSASTRELAFLPEGLCHLPNGPRRTQLLYLVYIKCVTGSLA